MCACLSLCLGVPDCLRVCIWVYVCLCMCVDVYVRVCVSVAFIAGVGNAICEPLGKRERIACQHLLTLSVGTEELGVASPFQIESLIVDARES